MYFSFSLRHTSSGYAANDVTKGREYYPKNYMRMCISYLGKLGDRFNLFHGNQSSFA